MARSDKPRQLIVEGPDDLFAVVGLMSAHCEWPTEKERAPVWIVPAGGVEVILEPGYISTFFKMREISVLGIVLDADEHAFERYRSIRRQCVAFCPDMPEMVPPQGLIVSGEDGKRFGVWVMPDNTSPGSLEVFLQLLVPEEVQPLWRHAEDSVEKARRLGATVKPAHVPKAQMRTLLVWQDEPGQSFGVAISKSVLDPHSPSADPFVAWFKELYEL